MPDSKNPHLKAMNYSYWFAWACLIAMISAHSLGSDILNVVFFALGVFTLILTHILLYKAAHAFRGKSYAVTNTCISAVGSLAFGIGFVIWPQLIRAEISKHKNLTPQEAASLQSAFRMMYFFKVFWLCLVLYFMLYVEFYHTGLPGIFLFAAFAALILMYVYIYKTAHINKGHRYAIINTTLAVIFTPVLIGPALWPPLVNSKVKHHIPWNKT